MILTADRPENSQLEFKIGQAIKGTLTGKILYIRG